MLARMYIAFLGMLLIHSSIATRPVGSACHASLDCESSYCNQKQQCEEQAEIGAPCPAGVDEACRSLNCKGGFCARVDPQVHMMRELQLAGANVTRAPQVGANATRAPEGEQVGANVTRPPESNTTWNGVIIMNETHSNVSNNIFDHDDGTVTDDMDANANASVAPRPPTLDEDMNANASVTPRPSPVDGNATMGPETEEDTPDFVAGSPCTSDENCGVGYFCSGIGICEELSCVNWANHTPAEANGYSEVPCVGEGAEEGTAFCGWDGNCYEYSCQNWYQFGPVAFTGYNPADPVELTCEDYSNGAEENLNSVTFGCRPWDPYNIAPVRISWTHFFNQKCEVSPRNDDVFTCYDNRVGTNYGDFLGAVARLNPPPCDRETYGPLGLEQPIYWYIIQMWQDRQGAEIIKYKRGRENTKSTASFNPNLAEKTMFATIVSPDPAPQQTFPGDTVYSGAASLFLLGGFSTFWLLVVSAMFLL